MCGIAGVIALDGSQSARATVQEIVARLSHRGPDDCGFHFDGRIGLGHRRLSILNPTPAGAQPMRRGENWLIHNGEIYNYLELMGELERAGHRFKSASDTEVILAAYEAWGEEAFALFNGMWAFALWDGRRQRLVLSRDRLGVKPLYVRRTSRSLAFASEVVALAAARGIDPGDEWRPEPDLAVVHDFLASGQLDHSDRTFIDGIVALPAAHTLIVGDGAVRLVRYWDPPPLADDSRPTVHGADAKSDAELVDAFADAFDRSVRLRLRSDVPIGTCLSGGLDSSSIVVTASGILQEPRHEGAADASAHEQLPRFAFHARFPEDNIDESPFAEAVSEAADVRLVLRSPSARPLLPTLVTVLRAQGEPFGGASIIAQHAVMAAAHETGIKVLLDGQGADELLGGYVPYLGVRAAGLLVAGQPAAAAGELGAAVRLGTLGPAGALRTVLRALAHGPLNEHLRAASRGRYGIRCGKPLVQAGSVVRRHGEQGTFLARRLWQDLTIDGLPGLLRYEDRNSMAFGIESRVPFLDVNLVELAVRLPDRLRVGGGLTKVALRRSMAHRLPRSILARRDKLGFAAPEAHGWRRPDRRLRPCSFTVRQWPVVGSPVTK